MRIEEEKTKKINHSSENKPEIKQEEPDKNKVNEKRKTYSSGCLRTLGCFIFILIVIFIVVCLIIIFIAAPLVNKTDTLPNDFPQELIVYRLNEAKIKVQDQENKLKAIKLIEAVPSWLIAPFLNIITPDPTGQIHTFNKEAVTNPENLEASLKKSADQNEKTVSLSWQLENKDKADVFNYYKEKLTEEDFEFEESISDYEMNLNFIKDGVSGVIIIMNDFTKNNSSLINMTVNYLSK
jgi:hypothetical protein